MTTPEELREAIALLQSAVTNATGGLPEDLFLFVSQMTPMVNVDLLIQDAEQRLLLCWRDDDYDGSGWHVPGGIIRFKETAAARIRAVARLELGAEVAFDNAPAWINESILPVRTTRGHFISLLYRCRLTSPPAEHLRHVSGTPLRGQWRWHAGWPGDLVKCQRYYCDAIPLTAQP
jgi:colanic acid biosynthesis protein WcaH